MRGDIWNFWEIKYSEKWKGKSYFMILFWEVCLFCQLLFNMLVCISLFYLFFLFMCVCVCISGLSLSNCTPRGKVTATSQKCFHPSERYCFCNVLSACCSLTAFHFPKKQLYLWMSTYWEHFHLAISSGQKS